MWHGRMTDATLARSLKASARVLRGDRGRSAPTGVKNMCLCFAQALPLGARLRRRAGGAHKQQALLTRSVLVLDAGPARLLRPRAGGTLKASQPASIDARVMAYYPGLGAGASHRRASTRQRVNATKQNTKNKYKPRPRDTAEGWLDLDLDLDLMARCAVRVARCVLRVACCALASRAVPGRTGQNRAAPGPRAKPNSARAGQATPTRQKKNLETQPPPVRPSPPAASPRRPLSPPKKAASRRFCAISALRLRRSARPACAGRTICPPPLRPTTPRRDGRAHRKPGPGLP